VGEGDRGVERMESKIPKVVGSGRKKGRITQHCVTFHVETAQRGGSQQKRPGSS